MPQVVPFRWPEWSLFRWPRACIIRPIARTSHWLAPHSIGNSGSHYRRHRRPPRQSRRYSAPPARPRSFLANCFARARCRLPKDLRDAHAVIMRAFVHSVYVNSPARHAAQPDSVQYQKKKAGHSALQRSRPARFKSSSAAMSLRRQSFPHHL